MPNERVEKLYNDMVALIKDFEDETGFVVFIDRPAPPADKSLFLAEFSANREMKRPKFRIFTLYPHLVELPEEIKELLSNMPIETH